MGREKWTTDIMFNIESDDIYYNSDLELNTRLEIVKEPNTDIMPDPNDQRHTEILVCYTPSVVAVATFSVTRKLINSLLGFLYLYSFEKPSQLSLMSFTYVVMLTYPSSTLNQINRGKKRLIAGNCSHQVGVSPGWRFLTEIWRT